MILISNAAAFSKTEITGWLEVNPVSLPNQQTAFQSGSKYASVRANGNIEFVDTIGINESFLVRNGTARADIGEGPRVLYVIE